MYFTAFLFTIAAFSSPLSASYLESNATTAVLPLQHYRGNISANDLIRHGRARHHHFNGKPKSSAQTSCSNAGTTTSTGSGSGSAVNVLSAYLAPVNIGGKIYQLVVDTGSSNTWCGAQQRCEPSKTGKRTGQKVKVTYGSGSFSGIEYLDQVSYGGLTVKSQSIGSARTTSDFEGTDGILGLGPVALTEGTVSGTATVPTFMNNLYKQGSISTEMLGIYFKPENGKDTDDNNGEITLGGVDYSKFNGSIKYFPKLSSASGQAGSYWALNINSFSYGSNPLDTNVRAVVDTGTTLIYVSTNTYNNFLTYSGGNTDPDSGMASWSGKPPAANFNIQIGSTVLPLTPSQYLIPAAEYEYMGLAPGKYYSWIVSSGTENSSDGGVDAVLGQRFLENYYSVYDTTNARIGFAPRN